MVEKYYNQQAVSEIWDDEPNFQCYTRKAMKEELRNAILKAGLQPIEETLNETIDTRMSDGSIREGKWDLRAGGGGGSMFLDVRIHETLVNLTHEARKIRQFLETGKPSREAPVPMCWVVRMTMEGRRVIRPKIPKARFFDSLDKGVPEMLDFTY